MRSDVKIKFYEYTVLTEGEGVTMIGGRVFSKKDTKPSKHTDCNTWSQRLVLDKMQPSLPRLPLSQPTTHAYPRLLVHDLERGSNARSRNSGELPAATTTAA